MATSSAAEIADEMFQKLSEDEQKQDLKEKLQPIVDYGVNLAKSLAPVGGPSDPLSGTFRDSIHSKELPDRKYHMPAMAIVSDDPAAVHIEYGTSKTPEHGTFAKTEQALAKYGAETAPYWTEDSDPGLRPK